MATIYRLSLVITAGVLCSSQSQQTTTLLLLLLLLLLEDWGKSDDQHWHHRQTKGTGRKIGGILFANVERKPWVLSAVLTVLALSTALMRVKVIVHHVKGQGGSSIMLRVKVVVPSC